MLLYLGLDFGSWSLDLLEKLNSRSFVGLEFWYWPTLSKSFKSLERVINKYPIFAALCYSCRG